MLKHCQIRYIKIGKTREGYFGVCTAFSRNKTELSKRERFLWQSHFFLINQRTGTSVYKCRICNTQTSLFYFRSYGLKEKTLHNVLSFFVLCGYSKVQLNTDSESQVMK